MADVSVRPAVVEDAGELARIQLETWRTAYTSVLPAAVLESLDAAQAEQVWQSAIATPPSRSHRVLVALEQQWRVGFVAFAPADESDAASPDGATGSRSASGSLVVGPLLVEPRWGRRGHGARLLAAVADLARQDGVERLITWIPAADRASESFLTSAGWAPDGMARTLDTGAGELREIRLHTSLLELSEQPEHSGPTAG